MAVVSLPSSVYAGSDAIVRQGTAGVAIVAGDVIYQNLVTGRMELGDADASSTTAEVAGIAISSAPAVGQPVNYLTEGTLLGASGLKQGQPYLLANVAGDVAESTADITEDTSYVSSIGIGLTTTSMKVKINNSGVKMNLA